MTKRVELRNRYMDGWYEMDLEKLLSATAPDFIFDDPVEPHPVTKSMLQGYMERWQARTGNMNQWKLSHEVREDKNGILTDWEWWEVVGTSLCGTAVVLTDDTGVKLERITYFTRSGDGGPSEP